MIARLSPGELLKLQNHLVPVSLPMGRVLYEAQAPIGELYFLTDGAVSLLQMTEDGSSAEIAVVGSEGVVGISTFMGARAAPWRTLVQSPACALRLKAEVLQRELARGGELQHLLLRYTQALMAQIAQSAVCHRHHSVEQQLCRWLLASLDRSASDQLVMTQELLANMLGVRRERVTAAAGKLQLAGLIRYARGRIVVANRPKIEQRACECYAAVKRTYDELLPAPESSRVTQAREQTPGNVQTPIRRVAVIMQRRAIDDPRQSEVSGPVGVLENYAGAGEPQVLIEKSGITQWLHPGFDIVLRRSETEGYFHNLSTAAPDIFVLWRTESGRPVPHYATVSCDEANRWIDGGAQVGPVCMPAAMCAWVRQFVEQNHRPELNKRIGQQSLLSSRERHEAN